MTFQAFEEKILDDEDRGDSSMDEDCALQLFFEQPDLQTQHKIFELARKKAEAHMKEEPTASLKAFLRDFEARRTKVFAPGNEVRRIYSIWSLCVAYGSAIADCYEEDKHHLQKEW